MKRSWPQALTAALLLGLFIWLARRVGGPELAAFDTAVGEWVWGWRSPVTTGFFRLVTLLGTGRALLVLAVAGTAVLYRLGRFREALVLLVGLLGSWGLETVLKDAFQRLRPSGPWLGEASGYSFPSGHATVSVVFYGLWGYLLVTRLLPRGRGRGGLGFWSDQAEIRHVIYGSRCYEFLL